MTNAILLMLLDKGLIPLTIIIVGWVVARYLAPYLAAHPNAKKAAVNIAQVADDISHILLAQYPNASWDDHVAKLVDNLIKSLDLSDETAERAAKAALLRRKVDGIPVPDMIPLRNTILDESRTEK